MDNFSICKRINVILILFLGFWAEGAMQAETFRLSAPDGRINVEVNISDQIHYSIYYNDEVLLRDCHLGLKLHDEILGNHPRLIKEKQDYVEEVLEPVVAFKFKKVNNNYNQLLLEFRDDYSVEFRVFDDGVAYRFITGKKKDLEVLSEDFVINFPRNYTAHLQQTGSFKTSYEDPYTSVATADWSQKDKMSTLPVLIDTGEKYKILISESDVRDYPCMFLKGNGVNGMASVFPKYPLKVGDDGDRSVKILDEAEYIARTKGKRTFPWRYFVITEKDGELIENTMTMKLAPSCLIQKPSWIKPGQASWEWWNGASPYGPDVNFVAGFNLETYKYFIDFAAKFGIPYIIMDEGWALDTRDPYTPNPKVDLHELIKYGKERNVGIVLWLTWLTVEKNFELFKTFKEWGVSGVKIDFMDRSDQWMVDFYERVAREAAKNELFVDFHGSFKPAGLEYAYPNILSYEGVRGMEQMGGTTPGNSIYFPFMRNAVGPMDYTPGAMISMQLEVYCSQRPNSASIGTRAYQMALFVVFESGLQMLADNPTLYYRNRDCTEFITQVPVTWDETRALDAKTGEYVIVAKRKGNKWFIGGMTNNEKDERTFEIGLDFLDHNRKYKMTAFEDGINAQRQAMDYRKITTEVCSDDKITIKMVRNGGWAAVLE